MDSSIIGCIAYKSLLVRVFSVNLGVNLGACVGHD